LNDESESTYVFENRKNLPEESDKIMISFKTCKDMDDFLNGWAIYYNYFRSLDSGDMTLAQKAGIDFPYHNWKELIDSFIL
jgi:hypothetical protein